MDLRDLEHNTRDGLHIASLAGTWLAVVAGFGGMRDYGGRLSFHPQLPPGWTRLRFRLVWHGARIKVDVGPDEVTYSVTQEPDDGIEIWDCDEAIVVKEGAADHPSHQAHRADHAAADAAIRPRADQGRRARLTPRKRSRPHASVLPMSATEQASAVAGPPASRATGAVYVAFILSGFAFASWASRIPQIRDSLAVSPAQLGFILLCVAAGSITSIPLAGTIVGRFGEARTVAIMSTILACGVLLVGIGTTIGVPPVCVGLALVGFGNGAWDVAMNVQGAAVERVLNRSIMSRFHAGFSVGTVAGAGVGAAMVALNIGVMPHLIVVAAAGRRHRPGERRCAASCRTSSRRTACRRPAPRWTRGASRGRC